MSVSILFGGPLVLAAAAGALTVAVAALPFGLGALGPAGLAAAVAAIGGN